MRLWKTLKRSPYLGPAFMALGAVLAISFFVPALSSLLNLLVALAWSAAAWGVVLLGLVLVYVGYILWRKR